MKKIILLMMVLCLTQSGQAAVIEIGLTGQVDNVYDTYNLLEGKIQQGDIMTGYYIYDSTTPDSNTQREDTGTYLHTTVPYGLSMTIGNLLFSTDPSNVELIIGILNNYSGNVDLYSVISRDHNLVLPNGVSIDMIAWQLDDRTGTALSSDALPIQPPDLSVWESKTFSISGGKYPFPSPSEKTLFTINGHITSVSPEPGTFLLIMMGAVALYRKNSKKY